MCVSFVLLAGCTSVNIFFDKLCHSRPPVSCGDKLFGFKVARVSCGLVVMEFFN